MNATEQLLTNRDCIVELRLQGKEPLRGKLLVPHPLERVVYLDEKFDYEGFGEGGKSHVVDTKDIVSVNRLPSQAFPIKVPYADSKRKMGITW